MISQCHFTRGILPLLLSTRQRRNDMNGRDDTRDLHHCCDCVSLQYGSGNLAADCIRKDKRIRSRQADDATFFNRGLCDHAAFTVPACPRISASFATLVAQLASRLRRWPLCRKLEGRRQEIKSRKRADWSPTRLSAKVTTGPKLIGARQAALRSKGLRPNVAVRANNSKAQVEDASGTDAETTAMSVGSFNPEISAGSTVSPDIVYLPIVPVLELTTNKSFPATAISVGKVSPEISAGFTGIPESVYSPIVPVPGALPKSAANSLFPKIAIPVRNPKPETTWGFTSTPEVVYSLTSPPKPTFAIKSLSPDTTMSPTGPNPGIRAGFTVAPEVVYLPILLLSLVTFEIATNKSLPDTAIPDGPPNVVISAGFTVAPEIVYSPILPVSLARFKLVTNKFSPDTAMPCGRLSPEISAGSTVAPKVVYSPIVPVSKFATKICAPRIVPGMAQSAADAAKPERINRIFIRFQGGEAFVFIKQITSGFRSWFKEILQKVSRACQDEWTRGRSSGPQQRFGARITDSSSTKSVSFSSARTMNRRLSPRCASAKKIRRPLESAAETQPQLQPALLRLSAIA